MVAGGDAVDRAFSVVLADDRRKLSEEEEAAGKRLWRQVFRQVGEKELLEAVTTWLKENRRGRPNIGEVSGILKRAEERAAPTTASPQRFLFDDRELRWAVSISQDPYRYSGPYKHTLEMAEHVLSSRGYQDWRDAKAYLEPGWTPVTVSEVYL